MLGLQRRGGSLLFQDSETVKYLNLIKSCSTNQVGNTQLTRHRSFTCQWIFGVLHLQCHPSVDPWCASFAASSVSGSLVYKNFEQNNYIRCRSRNFSKKLKNVYSHYKCVWSIYTKKLNNLPVFYAFTHTLSFSFVFALLSNFF